MVLVRTAMRNDGKCVPCRNGTRETMEASRRWYREERERDKTDPGRIYWRALVDKVHRTEAGFEGLSEAEKKYFAVCCLTGEVYNGGFHQFFFNSAGAYYAYALSGLEEMEAGESLQLLKRAKQVWFDFSDVPSDTRSRRLLLDRNASRSRDARSDELDRLFWKEPDELAIRCEQFARQHKLY
jgi:hypothetical protein